MDSWRRAIKFLLLISILSNVGHGRVSVQTSGYMDLFAEKDTCVLSIPETFMLSKVSAKSDISGFEHVLKEGDVTTVCVTVSDELPTDTQEYRAAVKEAILLRYDYDPSMSQLDCVNEEGEVVVTYVWRRQSRVLGRLRPLQLERSERSATSEQRKKNTIMFRNQYYTDHEAVPKPSFEAFAYCYVLYSKSKDINSRLNSYNPSPTN